MAIAYVNSTGGEATSASSLTYQHTVAAGDDRLLVVIVQLDDTAGSTVSSITYNGDSLTKITQVNLSTSVRSEMWYMVAPDVGTSQDVVVTANQSTGKIISVAANYTGVRQTTIPDNSTSGNTAGFSGTTKTVSLTTSADNCWTVLLGYATSSNVASGTGSTERAEPPTLTRLGYFDSNGAITPAGSTNMSFVFLDGDNITWIMASFAPVEPPIEINLTDGVAVGDSLTLLERILLNITDGVKVGDTVTILKRILLNITDGLKIGDLISNISTLWSLITKNVASWTNINKSSSSSWTNTNKNSTNWDAEDK